MCNPDLQGFSRVVLQGLHNTKEAPLAKFDPISNPGLLGQPEKSLNFFHAGGLRPPAPPLKVGRLRGLRNDGPVHGPWPGPMALAHWARVRPWSMGPGLGPLRWLAGRLEKKFKLFSGWTDRKKKFCAKLFLTFHSTNPWELLNRIALNPLPFYSIIPWKLWNRMGWTQGDDTGF